MQVKTASHFGMTYSSYVVNCPYEKLHCQKQISDPNVHKTTCVDGTLSCGEFCKQERVICDNNRCYDIDKQRCDGQYMILENIFLATSSFLSYHSISLLTVRETYRI